MSKTVKNTKLKTQKRQLITKDFLCRLYRPYVLNIRPVCVDCKCVLCKLFAVSAGQSRWDRPQNICLDIICDTFCVSAKTEVHIATVTRRRRNASHLRHRGRGSTPGRTAAAYRLWASRSHLLNRFDDICWHCLYISYWLSGCGLSTTY